MTRFYHFKGHNSEAISVTHAVIELEQYSMPGKRMLKLEDNWIRNGNVGVRTSPFWAMFDTVMGHNSEAIEVTHAVIDKLMC